MTEMQPSASSAKEPAYDNLIATLQTLSDSLRPDIVLSSLAQKQIADGSNVIIDTRGFFIECLSILSEQDKLFSQMENKIEHPSVQSAQSAGYSILYLLHVIG